MGYEMGHRDQPDAHDRDACPTCRAIVAAARAAKQERNRPSGGGTAGRPRRRNRPADRVWEAALLGHLQLVSRSHRRDRAI